MCATTTHKPLLHKESALCEKCRHLLRSDVPLFYCPHHQVLLLACYNAVGQIVGYRTVAHVQTAEQAELLVRSTLPLAGEYRTAA